MHKDNLNRSSSLTALATIALVAPFLLGTAFAQTPVDPGVRGGAAGAGGPIAGLNTDESNFFLQARNVFSEVDAVPDGLGPRFNSNGCATCHAQPAPGGSSPATNPQIAAGTADGAQNVIPSFITANGPVREARFINNPDGTPDGGVHDLFVITGRADAPGCNIAQPNFAQQLANNNVIFRIPTPTFGAGLVENTPDTNFVNDVNAIAAAKQAAGINGHFNRSGNDGTITRFGWKAQNKSLLIFAGEAYNVEQGVTNENFPDEREDNPNCQFNATPEDHTNFSGKSPASNSPASDFSSDIVNQSGFMRFLAAPTPAPATASTTAGQQAFNNVGCSLCHITSHKTHTSSLTSGLNSVTYSPFSDFLVHDMGALADNVTQGNAGADQFRTAPLWGLGQRIFFLHDGRTTDLVQAIDAHESQGSAASGVVENFENLPVQSQQNVLNFLRSL